MLINISPNDLRMYLRWFCRSSFEDFKCKLYGMYHSASSEAMFKKLLGNYQVTIWNWMFLWYFMWNRMGETDVKLSIAKNEE